MTNSIWRSLARKQMLITLLMGFASGLPYLLTSKTLQTWMADVGINLTTVGIMAFVALPYTLKFLWAPVIDMYVPPFFGRRRGWMLIAQIGLAAALVLMSVADPHRDPWLLAAFALLASFFSASLDIVIDAYRRETLSDEELGMGSSMYIYGYRIGILIAGAGALFLADHMPWSAVYILMAVAVGVGILVTLWADEPELTGAPPRNLVESVTLPLLEFFRRRGALEILAFVLLYKLGEAMAMSMSTPMYLKLGFSKTEIAAIAKTFGFFAVLVGAFVGGAAIIKIGINKALWIFGVFQSLAILMLSVLSQVGYSTAMLTVVILSEDLSQGMATSAFTAYMASQTNKRFTATQYALLSSLIGVPRVILSTPTGWMVEQLGWFGFFNVCTLITIPGLLLLFRVAPWSGRTGTAKA